MTSSPTLSPPNGDDDDDDEDEDDDDDYDNDDEDDDDDDDDDEDDYDNDDDNYPAQWLLRSRAAAELAPPANHSLFLPGAGARSQEPS